MVWCLLALQLSGEWKLLLLLQWLARKVSVNSVQNPISLRAKQGRTLLSCCMPLLGGYVSKVLSGFVEHLPFTSQPCKSGEKLQAEGVSDPRDM